MFPNVPLYPRVVAKVLPRTPAWTSGSCASQARLARVRGSRRRVPCACATLLLFNVCACCALAALGWKLRGRGGGPLQSVPVRSRSGSGAPFWNSEQRRLDLSGPSRDSCEADRRVVTQVWDYNTLPRGLQDFLLYMRCRKSSVLVSPGRGQVCGQARPFLLLAIKSLVPHFERRQAIRQTWGGGVRAKNRTVAAVFLLGRTPPEDHHPDLRGMLGREAELHGDLLQWEFRDTPLNSSLKEALFLRWFRRNCRQARFVLEAHDDVFVDTSRVLDFLENLPGGSGRFLFVGDVVADGRPPGDRAMPDFVPPSFFAGAYPPYAASGGVLLSGEVASRLHDVSRRIVLFPLHEVYAGLCLRKLGLRPQEHPGFAVRRDGDGGGRKRGEGACARSNLLVASGRTAQDMLRMWNRRDDCDAV
ncbi:N-acetyllactosaminide beta-1,3-N-acetylglucosaminyltransferase 2a [Festucalex cinctus]